MKVYVCSVQRCENDLSWKEKMPTFSDTNMGSSQTVASLLLIMTTSMRFSIFHGFLREAKIEPGCRLREGGGGWERWTRACCFEGIRLLVPVCLYMQAHFIQHTIWIRFLSSRKATGSLNYHLWGVVGLFQEHVLCDDHPGHLCSFLPG